MKAKDIELSKDEALTLLRLLYAEQAAQAVRAGFIDRLCAQYKVDRAEYKLNADAGKFEPLATEKSDG